VRSMASAARSISYHVPPRYFIDFSSVKRGGPKWSRIGGRNAYIWPQPAMAQQTQLLKKTKKFGGLHIGPLKILHIPNFTY